jgi:hypothetical protein
MLIAGNALCGSAPGAQHRPSSALGVQCAPATLPACVSAQATRPPCVSAQMPWENVQKMPVIGRVRKSRTIFSNFAGYWSIERLFTASKESSSVVYPTKCIRFH